MYKVKAKIYLYKCNGRTTPFESGYRPLFNLEDGTKISGKIDLINEKLFFPGIQDEVLITFLYENEFKVNSVFCFGEGLSILGEGEVLEIIE
jgi:translation elongation factor EF-Tu-like GTPase